MEHTVFKLLSVTKELHQICVFKKLKLQELIRPHYYSSSTPKKHDYEALYKRGSKVIYNHICNAGRSYLTLLEAINVCKRSLYLFILRFLIQFQKTAVNLKKPLKFSNFSYSSKKKIINVT